ncbi:hypothetical protein YPPY19_0992, partial [Yersinia pestis PY-19]
MPSATGTHSTNRK